MWEMPVLLISAIALAIWLERRRYKQRTLRVYNVVSMRAERHMTSYDVMTLLSTFGPTLSIKVIGDHIIELKIDGHESMFLQEDQQSHMWRPLDDRG